MLWKTTARSTTYLWVAYTRLRWFLVHFIKDLKRLFARSRVSNGLIKIQRRALSQVRKSNFLQALTLLIQFKPHRHRQNKIPLKIATTKLRDQRRRPLKRTHIDLQAVFKCLSEDQPSKSIQNLRNIVLVSSQPLRPIKMSSLNHF